MSLRFASCALLDRNPISTYSFCAHMSQLSGLTSLEALGKLLRRLCLMLLISSLSILSCEWWLNCWCRLLFTASGGRGILAFSSRLPLQKQGWSRVLIGWSGIGSSPSLLQDRSLRRCSRYSSPSPFGLLSFVIFPSLFLLSSFVITGSPQP